MKITVSFPTEAHERFIASIKEDPECSPITEAEESALFDTMANDNLSDTVRQAARKRIIKSQLLTVVKIAQSYAGNGVSIESLVSAGNEYLIKAIDKSVSAYNSAKGRLTTYLRQWILTGMREEISHMAGGVSITNSQAVRREMAKKRISEIEQGGEESYDGEYRNAKKLVRLATIYTDSLNAPIENSEGNETELQDNLSDDLADNSFESASKRDLKRNLGKELARLTKMEQEILKARFGFLNKPYKLQELAQMWNCTASRIQQIEQSAIKKIRVRMLERQ